MDRSDFCSVTTARSVDVERIKEAIVLCNSFLAISTVSHKFMQRFLGMIIKCTEAAKRFTARLLALLRITTTAHFAVVTEEARQDARWLATFLTRFNSVTLSKPTTADHVIEVDACLTVAGGWLKGAAFFHYAFPVGITDCAFNIAALGCFNLLVAMRVWLPRFKGSTVLAFCDNAASVCAVESERVIEPLRQGTLRELWLLCAVHDVELVGRHKPGSVLTTADALSRCHKESGHSRFAQIVHSLTVARTDITFASLSPPFPI